MNDELESDIPVEIYPAQATGSCSANVVLDHVVRDDDPGDYSNWIENYYRIEVIAGEGWTWGGDLMRTAVAHYTGVEYDRHFRQKSQGEWQDTVLHVQAGDRKPQDFREATRWETATKDVYSIESLENVGAIFVPGVYFAASPNFSNRGTTSCGSPGWNFSAPNRWPIGCTMSATAAEGYEFKNWTLNGVEVSTEASFVAEINPGDSPKVCQYVANFVASEYKVVVRGQISPSSAEGCSISPSSQTKTGTPGDSLTFTFTVTTAEHYRITRWNIDGSPIESKENTKTFTFEVYNHDTSHSVTAELESAHWHVGTGLPVHGEDGQLIHAEDGRIYYDSDRWIYGDD